MTHRANAWRMAMTLVVATGCTSEVEDPELADDDAVLDHVEALGFDRAAAKVRGARVIVDGDMLFDREGLLRGEYERPEPSEATDLIEKGYRYPALIAEKHRGNIRLAFATGAFAPTKEMRNAFIAAAVSTSAERRRARSRLGTSACSRPTTPRSWVPPSKKRDACTRRRESRRMTTPRAKRSIR